MLKSNPLQGMDVVGRGHEHPDGSELNLRFLFDYVRLHWRLMIATLLASLGIAGCYLALRPPQFIATARILIDDRQVQPFSQQAIVSELPLDATVVDSNVEVIRSEAVRLSVIEKLKLWADPEFAPLHPSLLSKLVRLNFNSSSSSSPVRTRDERILQALAALDSKLSVQRIARTYVLEISIRSSNDAKAALIANTFADAFIQDQLKWNFDATKQASDWLQTQLDELSKKVVEADRAVQNYIADHNLLDAGEGRTIAQQQLSDVNKQLVQAREQVAESKARLDRILSLDTDDIASPALLEAPGGPTIPVITKLREQYLYAVQQESELTARYGSEHSAVMDLRREIERLRMAAHEELERIRKAYRSDYELAKARQDTVEANLDRLLSIAASGKQAGVTLRMLESSAQSYRRSYDSLLQRFSDSTQQQSFPRPRARVITPARAGEQSQPKTEIVFAAALTFGLLSGVAIAYVKRQLDRSLTTARQVQKTLGTDCIGVVPHVTIKRKRRDIAVKRSDPISRTLSSEMSLERYAIYEPSSSFAEAIRRIKVAVDTDTVRGFSIGIVSTLESEGKSTVAANFAHLVGGQENRVLLIDANFRHPSLTQQLSSGSVEGLVQLLRRQRSIDDVLWSDPLIGVDFLPSGSLLPSVESVGLLSSAAMGQLLMELRARYKYVILDLPALKHAADSSAVSNFVDQFLLVIEWGQTSADLIEETLASSQAVHARLVGAVLNKADTTRV
ncbi:Wzz/FepE/Etk N-terminal domain-containing protein [Microvirga pudoricolor]|uniref:Wzz/FepE/Etk N-terminal domain-containing protein n=1 Tax=Microvirga pudoricolor TaxID=2778729 RepID=UPI00194F2C35|nr:Wzz/FepE/Etk N-terminal domain-containing protein [Microvirga pudoricolor]MBM6593013.1 AAA family ATPase [Microvirga pudoricolor]